MTVSDENCHSRALPLKIKNISTCEVLKIRRIIP